jgi:hypothetical protein
MIREDGYYWVKRQNVWVIEYFCNNAGEPFWTMEGGTVLERFWQEIDERRVVRGE